MQQLLLPVSLRDETTFDNFCPCDSNALSLQALQQLDPTGEYSLSYLCGPRASGRSHLLQAVCHRYPDSIYLPMTELSAYSPDDVFAALEHQPLVCIDDIDAMAGKANWEEGLFHFLNRKMLCGGAVLVSAGQLAEGLFALPDLVSRLRQGLLLRLQQPDDADKARVFIWRGQQRGIRIPEEVAVFVMRHYARDLHQLIELLERIDARSLQQQRRITIPFVRDLIDSGAT